MLLVCICIYLKSLLRYKFLILDIKSSGHYMYVRNDMRIRGYFLKPKGVREQKHLGNTGLRGTFECLYIYIHTVHID